MFDNFGTFTLRQNGATTFTSGTKTVGVTVSSTSSFTNQTTGTLNIQQLVGTNPNAAVLSVFFRTDASGFNNQGAINVTTSATSTGSAQFRAPNVGFSNAGRITVDGPFSSIEMAGRTFTQTSGSLAILNGGGMTAGGIANANVISISGSTSRLNLGGNVTGTGSLSFASGTLAATANMSIANAIALSGPVTFDSSTFTVDVTGNTSGGGSLVKTGANTVRLSGTGGHTGGATVSQGVLMFVNKAAQPVTGTTTVASGAAVALGVSASDPAYFNSVDLDALFAGTAPLVSNTTGVSTVGIDTSTGNFTYASNVSGPRGLFKLGSNVLTLSGSNSFSGGSAILAGGIRLADTSALGSGTFSVQGASTTVELAASGTIMNPVALSF